jgi:TatD DNase family protein
VVAIVSVGLNLDDSLRNRELAEAYPQVYFSVGWHPHEKVPPDRAQLDELDTLLRHPKALAVGEIGLDTYWRPGYHEVPLDVQERSLRAMLDLAAAHRKPVLVHDRNAHLEVIAELQRVPSVRGVMHCYSGDVAHAQRCADIGFVISFAGIVTFPSAGDIQAAARAVADDGFVVETDSPFLAPAPHRGETNVPAHVAVTAAAVAGLRGVAVETVRTQTTNTARRLLGIAAGEPERVAG